MARICINELANYNNGELVFKWFDLDDYVDSGDFWEDVSTWLASCVDQHGQKGEEWILGDVEDIPEQFYSEYSFDAAKFFEYQELVNSVGEEMLEAYVDVFGDLPATAAEVNERFFKKTEHFDDDSRSFHIEIGCALVEHDGILSEIPESVSRYFDYAKYGRDHYGQSMGLSNGFVFWTA